MIAAARLFAVIGKCGSMAALVRRGSVVDMFHNHKCPIFMATVFALFFGSACDDESAGNVSTGEAALASLASAEQDVRAPSTIELSESVHTLTLKAKDPGGTPIGVMVLERLDPLADIPPDQQNGAAEPKWFPVYAEGYFDVTGLSDSEVAERAAAIADQIAAHPVADVTWCVLKIAAAAAMCMDGPALVLTCPIGLHSVMCECGPEVGIDKGDLKKFCGGDK